MVVGLSENPTTPRTLGQQTLKFALDDADPDVATMLRVAGDADTGIIGNLNDALKATAAQARVSKVIPMDAVTGRILSIDDIEKMGLVKQLFNGTVKLKTPELNIEFAFKGTKFAEHMELTRLPEKSFFLKEFTQKDIMEMIRKAAAIKEQEFADAIVSAANQVSKTVDFDLGETIGVVIVKTSEGQNINLGLTSRIAIAIDQNGLTHAYPVK